MFRPETEKERVANRRLSWLAPEGFVRLNLAAEAHDDPSELARRLTGAAEVLVEYVQVAEKLFGRKVHTERATRSAQHLLDAVALVPEEVQDELLLFDEVICDHISEAVAKDATADPTVHALVTAMAQFFNVARQMYVPGWDYHGDNSGLLAGDADPAPTD